MPPGREKMIVSKWSEPDFQGLGQHDSKGQHDSQSMKRIA